MTTHIDDILSCGEPGFFLEARRFSARRFGKPKVQGKSFVRVGMELVQEHDFSATSAQEDFTKNMQCLPTFPKLRAGRKDACHWMRPRCASVHRASRARWMFARD